MTSSADSYPSFSEKQVNMAGQVSLVKRSCACCKMYMDHLRGKMTSFLMFMSSNYRHSMTIPARFMNEFGGEISESIHIESPDSSVYTVKGTKYMNKMLPQSGWKAFVDAHPIEENDSLLFQHVGKGRFKVLIINPDGCEKVFPCDGIRISPSNIQERGTDYVHVSDSSHERADKSSRVRKRVTSNDMDCPSQRRKAARITKTSSCSSEESGADSEDTAQYECSSGFDDDLQTNVAPGYVISRKSILSEVQEEQVDAVIKEIQPETTVIVSIMKPSNVKPYHTILSSQVGIAVILFSDPSHSYLEPNQVIPRGYAATHLPHTSQVVTLQRPGKNKKWHPKLHIKKDRTSHMLAGPWSDFVQDNHLREGDICIFQLLKTAGIKFMVHLIRRQSKVVGALHAHGNSPGPGSGGGASSSRARATKAKANEPKIVHSGEQSTGKTMVTPAAEEPADQAPSSPYSDGPSSKAGHYILSSHDHLDDGQRKKVEDIVGSIQSEVPIYVAVMNQTSVAARGTCVLYFSKHYTSKYLQLQNGERTVTLMRNGKSSAWKVKMHEQVFNKGWHGFVCDNHLKLDDICLFQLTKDDVKMLTMTVYIIRHV